MRSSDSAEVEGSTESGWLAGRILIAMPTMADPRFARAVVYLCSHGPEGAMGLVINRVYGELNFRGLLGQMGIKPVAGVPDMPVHFGGPVDPARGFVLHTVDYSRHDTLPVGDNIALTATVEILKALANGEGPQRSLLALGYAGWGAGQLEAELQTNGWLVAAADEDLVFDPDLESKWDQALAKLGVSAMMLSGDMGHA